jgi:hypothetical protein
MSRRSGNDLDACPLMPDVEGLSANRPIRISGQEVAAWMEVAMDECGSEKDVLKPAQVVRTVASAARGVVSADGNFPRDVQISALPVFNLWTQLALCHAVALELVGHDHSRHYSNPFSNRRKNHLAALPFRPPE